MRYFKEHNIGIMVFEFSTLLIDLSKINDNDDMGKIALEAINNIMIELYPGMAQAETQNKTKNKKKDIQTITIRQPQDISNKKPRGRPRSVSFEKFSQVYEEVIKGSLRPLEAMQKLDMKKATFYRYKKLYDQGSKK